MTAVLVILPPGAEEIETITIGDMMVRAGASVTVASTTSELVVTGSRGLPLAAHTSLDAVLAQRFEVVYLPGGGGSAATHRDDARIQDLVAAQLSSQRLLAVICAAPIALVPRQLCAGRRLTSYPGVRSQVEPHCAAWIDEPVVIDGNLLTSQGPGTAVALGLALIRLTAGADVASKVAADMLVPQT
jgi:4-methyl-5(b-hydroxyethyl)-thiazole monophosphate biosynthesis